AGARLPVQAAGQLRAVPVDRGDRRGPLSPRALYVSPPLDAVPDAADLRRAGRDDRVRAADALEHAAAGADAPERAGLDGSRARVRAEDRRGRRPDRCRAPDLRVPAGPQPSADRSRTADP